MSCPFNNNYPCNVSRPCPYSYSCPQQDYRYNQNWGNVLWLVLSLVFMVWTVNAVVEARYSTSKPSSELQPEYIENWK